MRLMSAKEASGLAALTVLWLALQNRAYALAGRLVFFALVALVEALRFLEGYG